MRSSAPVHGRYVYRRHVYRFGFGTSSARSPMFTEGQDDSVLEVFETFAISSYLCVPGSKCKGDCEHIRRPRGLNSAPVCYVRLLPFTKWGLFTYWDGSAFISKGSGQTLRGSKHCNSACVFLALWFFNSLEKIVYSHLVCIRYNLSSKELCLWFHTVDVALSTYLTSATM